MTTNGGIPYDILLAEDYPANVAIATIFLELLGYRIDVASNGKEAIEKFKAKRYLAILMDVQMPVMNGLEATQLIRACEAAQGGAQHIPIIGMTARALFGDRDECMAAGMDDYIPKPFSLDILECMLARLANTRSAHTKLQD